LRLSSLLSSTALMLGLAILVLRLATLLSSTTLMLGLATLVLGLAALLRTTALKYFRGGGLERKI
jgi:hypothetical protein